jgi:hypothetical protein
MGNRGDMRAACRNVVMAMTLNRIVLAGIRFVSVAALCGLTGTSNEIGQNRHGGRTGSAKIVRLRRSGRADEERAFAK